MKHVDVKYSVRKYRKAKFISELLKKNQIDWSIIKAVGDFKSLHILLYGFAYVIIF